MPGHAIPPESGWSLSPATKTTAAGVNTGVFTLALDDYYLGRGAYAFTLSDGGLGGTFTPASLSTDPSTQTATFVYNNAAPGVYTLTASANPGPLADNTTSRTAQALVTGTSAPNAFSLTPAIRRGPANTPLLYTLTLWTGGVPVVAGVGGQAFTLTDTAGGLFSPGTTVTIPQGQSSVDFVYSATPLGTAIITAQAVGGPFGQNVQTTLAVITPGGFPVSSIINPADVVWGKGFLFATKDSPDDIPFGILQDISFKNSLGTKKLMGPEGLTALAVGASERGFSGQAKFAKIRLRQLQRIMGGPAPVLLAAVTDPNTAPTLAAGTAGTITINAGNTYVGVAFAYRNQYGSTLVSPVAAVNLAVGNTDSIGVTALGALPAAITSVDWYVTAQGYATPAAAQAAALFFAQNNAGLAFSITALPATTAATSPLVSNLAAASSVFVSSTNDEPLPFLLHLRNPGDGSQMECWVYGCISNEFGWQVQAHDFVIPDFAFEAFGDPTQPTANGNVLFKLRMPGDHTSN